jgi:L-ascorbate metabolism protein UlaG (beta-lactamase superfamily)
MPFRRRRFGNLDAVPAGEVSLAMLARWRRERLRKMRWKDYSDGVPNVRPDLEYLASNRSEPSITWIGHATFLIQMGGLNIVTDPVWARRMGFARRLAPPGIAISDMPPVDVVLVSHSHYDHLHIRSLRRLPGPRKLLVPAGLGGKLRQKGFADVVELHWWEHTPLPGVRATFVPAQHWTRRTPFDTNASHWGGWVLEQEAGPTVYFAGDSGYFRGFRDIGERFEIDVALMPIGAYEPEWFMAPQHVCPEEALQAFLDVKAKRFIPMHFGSFKLADDTPKEALERLEAARAKLGIDPDRLTMLRHGETLRLGRVSGESSAGQGKEQGNKAKNLLKESAERTDYPT